MEASVPPATAMPACALDGLAAGRAPGLEAARAALPPPTTAAAEEARRHARGLARLLLVEEATLEQDIKRCVAGRLR